jgi:hypothetical protein
MRWILLLFLLWTRNFPEHSINIQYKYNVAVKQWQQSTGARTPNMPKGPLFLHYATELVGDTFWCLGKYGNAGKDLRSTLSSKSKKLATQVDIQANQSTSIEAYLSCHLIPLDKNPGVRPIGIISGKSCDASSACASQLYT